MPTLRTPFVAAAVSAVLVALLPTALTPRAHAATQALVVSQVYGGGGNTGAPFTHDFIEIHNRSDQPVALDGLSLQYASATGTGNFGASSTQLTELTGTLEPGAHFLVQEGGGTVGEPLPTPDVVDPSPILMSASSGKVALVSGTSSLGCNGGSTPCGAAQLARIVDLVGYGAANFFEGSGAAPTLSNTTAALRLGGGATDTDNNDADFEAAAPNPRNSGSEPPPPGGCDVPGTHEVAQVQGSGTSTPLAGTSVRVEGVVTGDFQAAGQLDGFFVQDDTPDADPATSDGIFVFSTAPVAVGDRVLVSGTATESFGLTALSPATAVDVCGTGGTIAPASYDLPRPVGTTFEPVESVLLTFPDTVTATEHFQLGRFGEVRVSSDGRLVQPTQQADPGPSAQAALDLNLRRTLLLDDGSNVQNPATVPYLTPQPLRLGDTSTGITGVLGFGFGQYRLQPTEPIAFARTNPRSATPPAVGGDVRAASFNTLNYFTTLGSENPDARGADSAEELARQQTKLVAAITALDADVLGLMEIENNGPEAVGSLVDALNAATAPGTYAFVTEPVLNPPNPFGGTFGTDAIKVAIIYQPQAVTPVGSAASSADPVFDRPPLVQTFAPTGGGQFTVVVNHFKSKSCGGATGPDLDQGDGQACYNARRTAQAEALVGLLDGLDVPAPLLLGDLNSYAREDPVAVLGDAGYTGLTDLFVAGADRYSFVFDGQSGELDHALASPDLLADVTGAGIWHINADEPLILDYNTEFNPPGLYAPDAFRSSDHDPVIVGLDFGAPPTVDAGGPYTVVEGGTVELTATGVDPDGGAVTFDWDLDGDGTFETTGATVSFSAAGLQAPATRTVAVRATDVDGQTATDTASVRVIWDFGGFLDPVADPPAVNLVRAGVAVPLTFSLAGDQGLGILAAGSPSSRPVACEGGGTPEPLEPVSTAGQSGLTYDPETDTYTLVWKTRRPWAGTCRMLSLDLADETSYVALFQFR